jgi:hypothetical protein
VATAAAAQQFTCTALAYAALLQPAAAAQAAAPATADGSLGAAEGVIGWEGAGAASVAGGPRPRTPGRLHLLSDYPATGLAEVEALAPAPNGPRAAVAATVLAEASELVLRPGGGAEAAEEEATVSLRVATAAEVQVRAAVLTINIFDTFGYCITQKKHWRAARAQLASQETLPAWSDSALPPWVRSCPHLMPSRPPQARVEVLLEARAGVRVAFDAEAALRQLARLGLASRLGGGGGAVAGGEVVAAVAATRGGSSNGKVAGSTAAWEEERQEERQAERAGLLGSVGEGLQDGGSGAGGQRRDGTSGGASRSEAGMAVWAAVPLPEAVAAVEGHWAKLLRRRAAAALRRRARTLESMGLEAAAEVVDE